MVKPLEMPADSQTLKQVLHEKIEHLNVGDLSLLNRIVLQIEAEELVENLDAAFTEDRQAGKLTNQRVQQILAEVRRDHPYR